MSRPATFDPYVFTPFNGGRGKRFTVTTSSSTAYAIGGTQGEQTASPVRVLVTNGGQVSAFICFGQDTIRATTDCLEILPGTTVPFGLEYAGTSPVYIAAITDSGTTTIQVTAGRGA